MRRSVCDGEVELGFKRLKCGLQVVEVRTDSEFIASCASSSVNHDLPLILVSFLPALRECGSLIWMSEPDDSPGELAKKNDLGHYRWMAHPISTVVITPW